MNRVVDSEVSSVHLIGLGSLSTLHSQQLIVRIREWSIAHVFGFLENLAEV